MEVQQHVFVTSALDEEEWSTKRPGHLISEERAPFPFNRRLGRHHNQSGRFGKEKFLAMPTDYTVQVTFLKT
jgi:hypothetical protein